ncbi:MAG: T9SS type A sorting domain-containing protein [Saprospiraceae bacterium]|nr:T9SS type A sorting domain-containing protein [Candidatus Vicinibacter affinis]
MKYYLTLVLFCFYNLIVNSQELIITPTAPSEPTGQRNSSKKEFVAHDANNKPEGDWRFKINTRFNVTEHESPDVKAIKEQWNQTKKQTYNGPAEEPAFLTPDPVISRKFEGPWMLHGTPPDNSLAISTNGNIVAVNNDGIEYYSSTGTYFAGKYWSDFFTGNDITSKLYDPKVIFDSDKNRFILVVLHGSKANVSKVLLAISYSDNPRNDGWYYYTLDGDPTNSNSWFDYPGLGQSTNDIVLTGNLFSDDGVSNESIIYQIDKTSIYNRGTMKYYYYSGLSNTPINAFSLYPVSYGLKGNYGPGIYLVNAKSGGSDKLRLWYIDDATTGNPNLSSYTITVPAYAPGGNAGQLGSNDVLDSGDSRILGAFYLNGIVHVTHNTNEGNGWGYINYHRITVETLKAQSSTFGLQGSFDYAYPSLTCYAKNKNDLSVMIGFLRSGDDIYPQFRVVFCDQNMDWSSSVLVNSGESYVDLLNGTTERWGDYIGSCRQYTNSTYPRIWINGSYGSDVPSESRYDTYRSAIAEIYTIVSATENDTHKELNSTVFPNPVNNSFNYSFNLDAAQQISIRLLDNQGKIVKEFYNDFLVSGTHNLSFSKSNLTAGNYLLEVVGNKKFKDEKKIIIF